MRIKHLNDNENEYNPAQYKCNAECCSLTTKHSVIMLCVIISIVMACSKTVICLKKKLFLKAIKYRNKSANKTFK